MLFILILAAIVVFGVPRLAAEVTIHSKVTSAQDVTEAPVAIVFGAGLWRDGTPTPVLQDRVATAAELYFSGKVKKILMSGDNRFIYYNEPGAMKAYAIKLGVPESDVVLDYAGRRTYDTCYRARAIFGVMNAIVVTQRFHLTRALLLCSGMGIQAQGVAADMRIYTRGPYLYWNLREIPGIATSYWELLVSHPEPVLGNPEPIFPDVTPSMPFQ